MDHGSVGLTWVAPVLARPYPHPLNPLLSSSGTAIVLLFAESRLLLPVDGAKKENIPISVHSNSLF